MLDASRDAEQICVASKFHSLINVLSRSRRSEKALRRRENASGRRGTQFGHRRALCDRDFRPGHGHEIRGRRGGGFRRAEAHDRRQCRPRPPRPRADLQPRRAEEGHEGAAHADGRHAADDAVHPAARRQAPPVHPGQHHRRLRRHGRAPARRDARRGDLRARAEGQRDRGTEARAQGQSSSATRRSKPMSIRHCSAA